jgi:hypothetical protein
VATSQECPTNLWFNIENGQCDYQANVVECGGVVTTTAAIVSDNATPMPGTRSSYFFALPYSL